MEVSPIWDIPSIRFFDKVVKNIIMLIYNKIQNLIKYLLKKIAFFYSIRKIRILPFL